MVRNKYIKFLIPIAILVLALVRILNLFTDWIWFDSVAFGSIFTQTLIFKLLSGLVTGTLVFLIVYINLRFARSLLSRSAPKARDEDGQNIEYLQRDMTISDYILDFVRSRYASIMVLVSSLIVAVLSGITGSTYWLRFAQFLNSTPFGLEDPIFNTDVAYYVFKLPFYLLMYNTVISVLFLTTIAVAALYYLVGLFQRFQAHPGANKTFASAISHLSIIGAITLAVKAVGYKFDADQLMYSPRGVAFGASYTDIYASRPIFYIMLGLSILGAIIFLVNTRLKRVKLLVAVPAILIVFSILAGNFYPALIQQFVVTPNELEKERPYIENNMTFTRQAYGIADIEEKQFPAAEDLTIDDLDANALTVDNIRLHDLRPLLDTYNQIEAIRPYYDFVDVDIDRYSINNKLRQIMLSPRELNIDKLDESAKTWVNLHLKYTHGQGAVVSPVNEVTSQGLPTFFVQQVPPKSYEDDVAINEPDIYFGELTNHYIITNTKTPEIDYTSSEGPVTDFYRGEDGIRLTLLNKLLYSARLGTLKLFLNDDITAESHLSLNRNIVNRVNKIAPFLMYDQDPYLVVNDGRLFWIIDAYTKSSFYPYSEPYTAGLNYINNSVKVVIDAYNGTTNYYLFDETDPLAQTYSNIFPNLFTDYNQMPEGLKKHIRYPESMFRIQSQMLLHYHMTDVNTFFSKEDAWRIADEVFTQAGQVQVQPNYLLMKLPDEEKEEFIIMLPFTPAERNNLVAWLAARMDGDNYGELQIFQFPRQKFVNGTLTMENRIDQDTEISGQLTLWSQQGSGIIRGNMMVIPIDDSLLYVEPIYLRASAQGLPELKRIVVGYGDTLVMDTTLDNALARIFGQDAPDDDPTPPDYEEGATIAELTATAQEIYTSMNLALKDGRWADYGELLNELEDVLNKLAEISVELPGVVEPEPTNPDETP